MAALSEVTKDFDICVGVITSVSGVRGNVKIKNFTETPADIAGFLRVFDQNKQEYKIKIVSSRKDHVIADIGVVSRDEAEKLRNLKLFVKRSDLPEVSNDQFYHADLLGLDVRSLDNSKLGVVKDVMNFGAGDILAIYNSVDGKTTYYPFNRHFVPTVNLSERFIVVTPLEEVVAAE